MPGIESGSSWYSWESTVRPCLGLYSWCLYICMSGGGVRVWRARVWCHWGGDRMASAQDWGVTCKAADHSSWASHAVSSEGKSVFRSQSKVNARRYDQMMWALPKRQSRCNCSIQNESFEMNVPLMAQGTEVYWETDMISKRKRVSFRLCILCVSHEMWVSDLPRCNCLWSSPLVKSWEPPGAIIRCPLRQRQTRILLSEGLR